VESFLYQLLEDLAGIKPNPEHFKQSEGVLWEYRAASSLFVF
jgi:hypothetical protein